MKALEDQPRMSDSISETAESQLQMEKNKIERNFGEKWLVIAPRAFAICYLIVSSIELFGSAISILHCSIAASAGGQMQMISTESYAIRRRDSAANLGIYDFAVCAARIFRKTTNSNARVSNVFSRFNSTRRANLGNPLSREEETSPRLSFAHEDSTGADSVARLHEHIQFASCAMNCTGNGASDELLPGSAVRDCKFNLSNLVATALALELAMPNAPTIHPDASHDEAIVDRQQLEREWAIADLAKQRSPTLQRALPHE